MDPRAARSGAPHASGARLRHHRSASITARVSDHEPAPIPSRRLSNRGPDEPGPGHQRSAIPLLVFRRGNSRNGFETYFTLLNLSDQPASALHSTTGDDGIRLVQWLGIEPRARGKPECERHRRSQSLWVELLRRPDIVERTTTWGQADGETLVGFAPTGRRPGTSPREHLQGDDLLRTQNLTDAPESDRGLHP
jgi:hypothetical protein